MSSDAAEVFQSVRFGFLDMQSYRETFLNFLSIVSCALQYTENPGPVRIDRKTYEEGFVPIEKKLWSLSPRFSLSNVFRRFLVMQILPPWETKSRKSKKPSALHLTKSWYTMQVYLNTDCPGHFHGHTRP